MTEEISLAELKKDLDKRFDRIDRKLDNIGNDVSMLKGATALLETLLETSNIAKDMGMTWHSNLTSSEVRELTEKIGEATDSEISGNLAALRDVDVIMKTITMDSGMLAYIPMAVSWTLSKHDIDSAIMYANFLSKYTEVDLVLPAASGRNIPSRTLKYGKEQNVHTNQLRKIY
jgi:hypothetical protein